MKIKRLIVGRLETNCYLIISEKELVIIDPGGESNKILEEIEKNEHALKHIILTHSHLDHISAALEIKQKTGAKILIHELERYSLNFEPDILLKEEDEVKIGDVVLEILHTPGHTPGSICLLGKNFTFTGDTIFKDGVGRTDLPGGSLKYLRESLQRLSRIIKPGMKIYPGHGEIFEYRK